MVSMTFVKLAGYILAAIVLAVALSLFTPVIWENANTALATVDDFLGTDFSGPPKILIPNAEVLKDGNVKLSWIVDQPKKVGVTKVFGGYKQSYKKGEVEIKYADEKFLITTLGPQEKKEHEWTSKKLQGPGWYKFSVNLFDKENNLVDTKEVYVGYFDSGNTRSMEILYDEIIEYKKQSLFQSKFGDFIAEKSNEKDLPKDISKRKQYLEGLSREGINDLFDKWSWAYVDWLKSKGFNENDATSIIKGINRYLDKAPEEFEKQGMIDISPLKTA